MSTDPAPGPEAAELLAALRYPLQVDTILRKRKRLRRLLDERGPGQPVRIALLGGATTHELRELLELFLRARGFTPTFYESDYARYYEDGALGTPELDAFRPQLVFISAGFDAHANDPLAELSLGTRDYTWVTGVACDVAERHCGGRVVSTLEGGYDLTALATSAAAHIERLMHS